MSAIKRLAKFLTGKPRLMFWLNISGVVVWLVNLAFWFGNPWLVTLAAFGFFNAALGAWAWWPRREP